VPHLDDDRLILRALDDEPLTERETAHLDECLRCRADLDRMRQVVAGGRQTQGLQALPMPPPRVWERIDAKLAENGHDSPGSLATVQTAPPQQVPPGPSDIPVRDELLARRTQRRGPGWAMTALVAGVAAAVAAVITLTVTRQLAPTSTPTPQAQPCAGVADVRLQALPGVPAGVTGHACLRISDGQRRLYIHAEGMPSQPDGDYEAWLLDATSLAGPTLRMEALGVLGNSTDQNLPLPSNLDLSKYNIIDISAEPHDGNASHSGHSLLRGTLG
jgi:hypothetical protein